MKDKLLKIKELAERGERGEAKAAMIKLEALLKKYGLTIDDLTDEEKSYHWFKYGNIQIKDLILYSYSGVVKASEVTYAQRGQQLGFKLTKAQYVEMSDQLEFHTKNFNKEKSKVLKNLFKAYISKHNIGYYDENSTSSTMSDEDIRAAADMYRNLSDESFFKKLNK